MRAFSLARLHLWRTRTTSTLLILSLAIAMGTAGILLHLFSISENRYKTLAPDIQAVVGPKSGGIEILLGSLNLEYFSDAVLPANLFQTLRAGADIHFADGSTVSSGKYTKSVIPILRTGKIARFPVLGTDESFLHLVSATEMTWDETKALVGSQAAVALGVAAGGQVAVELDNGKRVNVEVAGVLPQVNSAWDRGIFVHLQLAQVLRDQAGLRHPVWQDKVLSYFLIQMDMQAFAPLQSLINDRSVAQMIDVQQERAKLSQISGSAQDLGTLLVIVICCLAGFAIFGMLSIRAEQLRVSVATLQAIGYGKSFVLHWLLSEALIVGVCAGVLGVVFEKVTFASLHLLLDQLRLLPADMSNFYGGEFLLFGLSLLFALLGAALPLWRSLRISVHQELKSG